MRATRAESRRVTLVVGVAVAAWLLGVPASIASDTPGPGGPAVSGGPPAPIDLAPAYVDAPIQRPASTPAESADGTVDHHAAAHG